MPFSVCLITSSFDIGGVETHVLTLAEELARRGYRVTVVSGGGAYEKKAANFRHIRLPLARKRAFLSALRGLKRLFKKERFDIIHVHARFPALLCRLLRVRFVSTVHWVFSTKFPKKALSFWGRECLAVSPDIKRYLETEYGLKSQNITVTVNGIDTSVFKRGPKTYKRQITLVSRLDKDRSAAAFCLLEAADILRKNFDFHVTIVGDGSDYMPLKQRAEDINRRAAEKIITMEGASTNVAFFLAESDIFIGVSRAAVEAMAAECAVVLAGNEGYLSVFDPKYSKDAEESNFCCRNSAKTDTEKLKRDLTILLSFPQKQLDEIGKKNRAYVEEHYSVKRMTDDALLLYDRTKKEKAVLCGYYGFGNIGDDLLQKALVMRLKNEGYEKIKILSLSRFSLSALYALTQGYDFFLGGGNLLQNETSNRSLFFYTSCMRLSYRCGGHLFMLSGGLGHFHGNGRKKAQKALALCERTEYRTENDCRLALDMGIRSAVLCSDAVLTLPFPWANGNGKNIILTFRNPRTPEERIAVTAYIWKLSKVYGKENLYLFAMHPKDEHFAKTLMKKTGIPMKTGDAKDFIAALCDAHAVYGNRLHAGICALRVGVMAYLWENEEKCRFFAEDVQNICTKMRLSPAVKLFSFSEMPRKEEIPQICFSKIADALAKRQEQKS